MYYEYDSDGSALKFATNWQQGYSYIHQCHREDCLEKMVFSHRGLPPNTRFLLKLLTTSIRESAAKEGICFSKIVSVSVK